MRLTLLNAALALTAAASPVMAQGIEIGGAAPALTFTEGADKALTVAPDKAPATVLVFVSSRCPVSVAYNQRMRALYDSYADKKVQFAFVSANINEVPEELAKLKTDAGFPFTVYRDVDNVIADKLGAQVTPEVFLFDKGGVLRYHGAIDDSRDEANIKKRSASLAIDAVLAGKPVEVAKTKAFGCTIKRKRAA